MARGLQPVAGPAAKRPLAVTSHAVASQHAAGSAVRRTSDNQHLPSTLTTQGSSCRVGSDSSSSVSSVVQQRVALEKLWAQEPACVLPGTLHTQPPILLQPSLVTSFAISTPPTGERTPSARNQQRSPDYFANVGDAIRVLREDIPLLFAKDLDYRIYRDDIVFKDPRNRFEGMKNYKLIFWSLRFHGKIFFSKLYVEVKRIWQPSDDVIKMRWTVHGIPRVPWETQGLFDGISTYKLDHEGKVYEHSVDNVLLRDPPMLTNPPLLAGLNLVPGTPQQPCPGAWGLDGVPDSDEQLQPQLAGLLVYPSLQPCSHTSLQGSCSSDGWPAMAHAAVPAHRLDSWQLDSAHVLPAAPLASYGVQGWQQALSCAAAPVGGPIHPHSCDMTARTLHQAVKETSKPASLLLHPSAAALSRHQPQQLQPGGLAAAEEALPSAVKPASGEQGGAVPGSVWSQFSWVRLYAAWWGSVSLLAGLQGLLRPDSRLPMEPSPSQG